jgi:hypothetical protein
LAAAEGPFDVVIDDGSHVSAHQITSFYFLFNHLRAGGFYVIEDIQTSFWPGRFEGAHISDPALARTFFGEMLELAKYINHAEFQSTDQIDAQRLAVARTIHRIGFEHNMIVVWKSATPEPVVQEDANEQV